MPTLTKILALTCLLAALTQVSKAQNLVPNPSFEEYVECPNELYGIEKAYPWTTYSGTPDLFNACDTTGLVSVPLSEANGYKASFDGVGHVGFIGITFPHWREVLGVSLTEPLIPGTEYYVSFQISRGIGGSSHPNCDCAMNNIGLKFLTHSYSYAEPIGQDNQADINYSEVLTDTTWTQISGWFIADSAYSHIAIGNFFDNDHNTLVYFNDHPFIKTYYFIDAVCVAVDPADCEGLVSVDRSEMDDPPVIFHPNPTTEFLKIYPHHTQHIQTVFLLDIQGRLIKSFDFTAENASLYVGDLNSGMYLVSVQFSDQSIFSQTIIKL